MKNLSSLGYGQWPLAFLNLLITIYAMGVYSAKLKFWHCEHPFLLLSFTMVIVTIVALRKSSITFLLVGLLLFFLGNIFASFALEIAPNNISNYAHKHLQLQGTLDQAAKVTPLSPGKARITYIVTNLSVSTTPTGNDSLKKTSLQGKIYVHCQQDTTQPVGKIGDTIKFSGEVKPIIGLHNPGLLDTEFMAHEQGIYAHLSTYNDPPQIISNPNFNMRRWSSDFRQHLLQGFLQILPKDNAYMLFAMLFGGYYQLNPELLEAFTATGIVHILSVSGSHISLLIGFILSLCTLFSIPKRLRLIVLIAFISLYVILCGCAPPVLRAAIMGILASIALFIGREKDAKHLLSLCALIMLLYNPLWIFNISFQLSFAATAGLIYLMPIFNKYFDTLPSFIANNLALTLSAQLATAPLLAWYFNTLSLSSLLANMISVPILELVIILAMGTCPFMYICPILAKFILGGTNMLLSLANYLTLHLATLPLGNIFLPTMGLGSICIYYLLLGILLFPKLASYTKNFLNKHYIYAFGIFSMICLTLIFTFHRPSPLQIHFIDVGQGDAALIITPHHHSVMIDTGGIRQQGKISSNFDIGTRIDIPYLHHQGITSLDYLILSHSHADHTGGAHSLLTKMPVKHLLISTEEPTAYPRALNLAPTTPILLKASKASAGTSFSLDGVKFTFIHPDDNMKIRHGNEASTVVMVSYKNFQALFTGDLEAPGEQEILTRYPKLHANLLKIGHHGSNTSSTSEFLAAVHPDYAIISCGVDNKFGHPKPVTLKKLQALPTKILRTDKLGAIWFTTDGFTISQHSYNES